MGVFTRHRTSLGGLAAAVAAMLCLALAATAPANAPAAGQPDCTGRGVPVSKISIQEYTFAEYIGFGSDAATQARLENVLAFLSETGYRNLELFTLSGLSAEQMRALLDKYHLKASARHVDVGTPAAPANLDQILADNKTLGIKYFGSGATPRNFTTEAQWIAYAEYLDAIGERARKAGQTLMVHNHNWEFETSYADTTPYDILLANTDPRNVVFQLDLYWSTRGLGTAAGATNVSQADDLSAALVRRLGNRAQLFHVKDMATGAFPGRIEIVGAGGIDFPSIFDASRGPVRYYVIEHDPRFGDSSFDPFEAATAGFEYLSCVRY
jgi:sugar phosphate isomerase/epimerase